MGYQDLIYFNHRDEFGKNKKWIDKISFASYFHIFSALVFTRFQDCKD